MGEGGRGREGGGREGGGGGRMGEGGREDQPTHHHELTLWNQQPAHTPP